MQFVKVLVVLASIITSIFGKCHDIDWAPEWPQERFQIKRETVKACKGPLSGDYLYGVERWTSAVVDNPKAGRGQIQSAAWFGIKFVGNYEDVPPFNVDHCLLRLGNEIAGCRNGGQSTFHGWQYTASSEHTGCSKLQHKNGQHKNATWHHPK